jgi:hypothetical protein
MEMSTHLSLFYVASTLPDDENQASLTGLVAQWMAPPGGTRYMDASERISRIEQYRRGPDELEAALWEAPEESRTWRPDPTAWSIHEIVVHCADSETSGYTRIRLLAAEPDPLIVGYDQDTWVTTFDYHARSLESSLAVIRAVRHHTWSVIRGFPDETWSRTGRHTQSGPYSSEEWLRIYSVHLSEHADQIRQNVERWHADGRS